MTFYEKRIMRLLHGSTSKQKWVHLMKMMDFLQEIGDKKNSEAAQELVKRDVDYRIP